MKPIISAIYIHNISATVSAGFVLFWIFMTVAMTLNNACTKS